MYITTIIVFALVVFVILYARFTNIGNAISKRKIQIDNLKDKVEMRTDKLKRGTAEIRTEIELTASRLQDLKQKAQEYQDRL